MPGRKPGDTVITPALPRLPRPPARRGGPPPAASHRRFLWGKAENGDRSDGVYTPESFAAFNSGGGFGGIPALTFCSAYLNGNVNGASPGCVRGNDGGNPGDADPYTSNGHHVHPINNKSIGGMARIYQ